MPGKSKSTSTSGSDTAATPARKTAARSASPPVSETPAEKPARKVPTVATGDTLDLIGERPKRARVKPGSQQTPLSGPVAVEEPPAPAPKKEVLSLIDDAKPRARRAPLTPVMPLSGIAPPPLP